MTRAETRSGAAHRGSPRLPSPPPSTMSSTAPALSPFSSPSAADVPPSSVIASTPASSPSSSSSAAVVLSSVPATAEPTASSSSSSRPAATAAATEPRGIVEATAELLASRTRAETRSGAPHRGSPRLTFPSPPQRSVLASSSRESSTSYRADSDATVHPTARRPKKQVTFSTRPRPPQVKLISSPDTSPRSPPLLHGTTPSYSSHQTRTRSPVPWLHGHKKDESGDKKGLLQIATPQNENNTSSSNVTPTSESEGSTSVSRPDERRLHPPPLPLRPHSAFNTSNRIIDDISSVTSPSKTESSGGEEKTSGEKRRRDTVPFKKPRDFPEGAEFAIKPRIAQIESKLFSLDEKTLKQFDVVNQRGRKTKRSHTAPAAAAPRASEDDWWGTASAPSEHGGSDSDVICEFFAIGTPTGARSRASSVCSLGSLYSTRSSKSSRSMKSTRSYVSTGSIYKCSSAGSIYSSDGSLYGDD